MKSIEMLLQENPRLPFKLMKFLDSSYEIETYYLAVEVDEKLIKEDICTVTDNYESKEQMETIAIEFMSKFTNIVEVVEVQC